jgi:hypothetical protein
MKFQIEENFGTEASKLFNRPRAFGCKELAANLEEDPGLAEIPRQSNCTPQSIKIQGND